MEREEGDVWRREVKVNGEEKGKGKLMLEATKQSFDGSKISKWLDRINRADGRGDGAGRACCFIAPCTCFLGHFTFPKVACFSSGVPIYMQQWAIYRCYGSTAVLRVRDTR